MRDYAGGAISMVLSILFRSHFEGSSAVTWMTKYLFRTLSPLELKVMLPVMPWIAYFSRSNSVPTFSRSAFR